MLLRFICEDTLLQSSSNLVGEILVYLKLIKICLRYSTNRFFALEYLKNEFKLLRRVSFKSLKYVLNLCFRTGV